jgi:hypothetical protein
MLYKVAFKEPLINSASQISVVIKSVACESVFLEKTALIRGSLIYFYLFLFFANFFVDVGGSLFESGFNGLISLAYFDWKHDYKILQKNVSF